MQYIVCNTNLDLLPAERWPETIPSIPRVGDRIQSTHGWEYKGQNVQLELEVVSITWKHVKHQGIVQWVPFVELHLPKNRFNTLVDFFEWYGRITGRGRSYFI